MMKSRALVVVAVLVAALAVPVVAASSGSEKEFEKAKEAYLNKDYAKAEKSLRAQTRSTPEFGLGHLYLAHSLFYQKKYGEAVSEYERARELVMRSGELKPDEERLLIDQLGMAYGLSGHVDKAKVLFETAIKRDPDYPMYYYNLACVYAEMGKLDETLSNLKEGFARKERMLPGETYPNPREDHSFKRYLRKEKFETAMKEMGY